MDEILEAAHYVREELQSFINPLIDPVPYERFESVGAEGILEIEAEGASFEALVFTQQLELEIDYLPQNILRSMCLAAAYRVAAIDAHKAGKHGAIGYVAKASEHVGFARGMALGMAYQDSNNARFAAYAKHESDPKQKDKAMVRECWVEWQRQPDRYKGKAAFARDMRDKFPNLESQPVIEGWCRIWERES